MPTPNDCTKQRLSRKQNSGNERRFEQRMTLDCERQFANFPIR